MTKTKFINHIANKTHASKSFVEEIISEIEIENFLYFKNKGDDKNANEYLETWQDDIKIYIESLTKISKELETFKG